MLTKRTSSHNIKNGENKISTKRKICWVTLFNKDSCLFCDNVVEFTPSKYNSSNSEAQKVKTIRKCCTERNDDWVHAVLGKIEYYSEDLHAADCVYQRSCSTNFRTGRQIPSQYINVSNECITKKLGKTILYQVGQVACR